MRRRTTLLIAACAAVLATAQDALETEKAARLRSQELFEGADDLETPTVEEYRARLSGMCVDAAGAALAYQGLSRSVPRIASDQPRTPALTPGSDFFMLFFQAMPPSVQKDNYYSKLTVRQDLEDAQGRNYQQKLESEILNSPGKLQPADVVRLALRVARGNYPLAMLTAHNLFKEITYRGRDEADINARARQGLPQGRAALNTIGIDPRYGKFAARLVPLRLSAHKDKMGPWYHFFVPLAVEAWASRHSAYWMEAFEHGARHIGLLSNDDHEKQRIDECATRTAYSIHEGLAGRPEAAEPPAEQTVALPPAAPAAPTGRIWVQLIDDLDQGNGVPFGARVTLTSEGEDGRVVIEMSPETEENVPPGVYTVRARVLDYAFPRGVTDTRGFSNPADWYSPGEARGVVVKAGELTHVVVRMPSTRGNLTVTVRDEKGQPLTGIAVSLSGPTSAGPFESPAAFQVAPGNYRVMVPKSEVNGKNYRGKAVAATVVANRTTEIAVDLEPYPPLPGARSISIEPGWLNLNVNDGYELGARVFDEQGRAIPGAAVTWSSSSAAVASVDAFGKVTGIGRGRARITARSGGASGSIEVTVASNALLTSCVISEHPKHLPAGGGDYAFKAVALDADGKPAPNVTFTWAGSNYVVGLVNPQTGKLTTEKPGDLTVYAQGKGPDGSEVSCSTRVTVDASYETVLVSGQVVRADGSAAAGAAVRASGGSQVTADAQGNFTAMAAKGPHAEGAAITAEATLGTSSGRASGIVKSGAVKGVRITLAAGSSQAAAEGGTKRRINAHLFRIWPIDNPKDVSFLLYANASRDKSGHFSFPDGNGGVYWRAGEDLGLYRDQDSLCAVLRGYGQKSVEYNLYWYTVTCPKDGPVAKPETIISGPPAGGAPTSGGETVTQLSGSVTVGGKPLRPRDAVAPGSSLEVGKDSRVSIRFRDGSVVTVGENSKVKVPAPGRVELRDGSVEVEHNRREGEPSFEALEVATPDARIVPTGTRYRVGVSGRGSSFEVLEGAARVTGSMLARTDAAFNVRGKTSFAQELEMKAEDRVFAFRVPSWTGVAGAGAAVASPLNRPDPWNDTQVQQLIDEWLRTATPETAARYPGTWRYSDWGVVIGPGTTVAGPPDHPAGWSRHQTLWAHRTKFGSLNVCTLGEFVERRIGGKGLDGCARGGGGSAVPSWMAPSPKPAQTTTGAAPPKNPLAQAREQAAQTAAASKPQAAPAPQPQARPPAPPLKLEGVWYCSLETSYRRDGSRSSAAPLKTTIRFGPDNVLYIDEKGMKIPPVYVRGNTVGYRIVFRILGTDYTATYDAELRGDVLVGTGKAVGSDGVTASQQVSCSGRYDPKR